MFHCDVSEVSWTKNFVNDHIGVSIVGTKAHVFWRLGCIHDETTSKTRLFDVCIFKAQPKIDIHSCLVGVQIDATFGQRVIFVC